MGGNKYESITLFYMCTSSFPSIHCYLLKMFLFLQLELILLFVCFRVFVCFFIHLHQIPDGCNYQYSYLGLLFDGFEIYQTYLATFYDIPVHIYSNDLMSIFHIDL